MQDYEKLGLFYLGKRYDGAARRRGEDLALYEANDLTTHAVIIGMTGSGKTGLGIGLLEEAAIDGVPVIAVDPKGDLGNLMLTFPGLTPAEFRPWVNDTAAAAAGMSPDDFAARQAETWRAGLAEWGQDAARIGRLRAAAEFAIYTPGHSGGRPLAVLRSFDAPPEAVRRDPAALREAVQGAVTALLTLLGIEADPLAGREHILLSTLLESAWSAGRGMSLADLVGVIQKPPFERVGVIDLESFFPGKERFALALRVNALLASPAFAAWTEGEPLDIGALLHTPQGKPRLSVLSIAHLGDAERMFFVSRLLHEVLSWIRAQPGTPSLRAILYMDEIFGYFPPTANPPSKLPMLTLLKQARAFGLGLVLATQNPVDLDYKGLANAGTWFIGRLQTERDKMRVLEALEGAQVGGGALTREALDAQLSALGKRVFLMHSVHEPQPTLFETRWTMSYLAGPLTVPQVKQLAGAAPAPAAAAPAAASAAPRERAAGARPVLPPGVKQYFLPAPAAPQGEMVFHPLVLGAAATRYTSVKYGVDLVRDVHLLAEPADGPVPLDWDAASECVLELDALASEGPDSGTFAEPPAELAVARNYERWSKEFVRHVVGARPLVLLESKAFKAVSRPDESERDFRARLGQSAREGRDAAVEALRAKYQAKLERLAQRVTRATRAQQAQEAQARQSQLDAAVSVGVGLLGMLLGGRRSGAATRIGSAARAGGRAYREGQDVANAAADLAAARQEYAALEQELRDELAQLEAGGGPDDTLGEVRVKAKNTDVQVRLVALVWAPFVRGGDGQLTRGW